MVVRTLLSGLLMLLVVTSLAVTLPADEPAEPKAEENAEGAAVEDEAQAARFRKLEETLSGTKLVGRFTMDKQGEDQEMPKEEYQILSAKHAQGDFWLITARIKYADKDMTVPLPLPIKWAGETPVITLSDFTIPGLGTFDCRVVIHDGKYAGTWRHGDVSGHLFGTIEKAEAEEEKKE